MQPTKIEIPELCLVVLIGATSSGKSSFARSHFKPTEVLSSDFFRGMVSDDENDQSVSQDAFDLLYHAAKQRLKNGRLTVIDATNLQAGARKQALDLAKEQNVHAAAIVLDLPEDVLLERNRSRSDRDLPERVVCRHARDVRQSIRNLRREGFRFVYVLHSAEEAEHAEIVRTRLWNDRRDEHGPFDVIGDLHGCYEELCELLEKLGYVRTGTGFTHPEHRKAAFLGDFCDRGPRNADVLRLVMQMVASGDAIAVPGNHDVKLVKYLKGKEVSMTHGLDRTVMELEAESEAFRAQVLEFMDGLVSHYVLDDGKLVIAHAGLRQDYIGRTSARVRDFCLYGETTGEFDSFGLPVRLDWAADYRGRATVVYGHIAAQEVRACNGTYCIDTGCVFGGALTAMRYPEREFVSVAAHRQYYEPVRPLTEPDPGMDDMLTVGDVGHKLHITTRLMPSVDIHENNAAAALEIMSRYAADPHWLIYLPPTMSPCETSDRADYLEFPAQAFSYYRNAGVRRVVCEKKHMGSRCVIVLCRDAQTAARRFSVSDGTRGIVYTRTGRHFFEDGETEQALLDRLDALLSASHFWEDFSTDWVCIDAELMPWSEKAQSLLRRQYAPTGNAGRASLAAAVEVLRAACGRSNCSRDVSAATSGQNVDPHALLERYLKKQEDMERYIAAYREYCWTVRGVEDLRVAPFHILACEGKVFSEEAHLWHLETIRKYMTGGIFIATPFLVVEPERAESVQEGIDWWLDLTAQGGEGMVVKPEFFTAKENGHLLQPAVKCRGREYLRIIYGAEYLEEEHLARLKVRSLSRKRSLALREFSLGLEALHRFAESEPLWRVHECVFGVLALESEPVDPRL